MVLLGLWKTRDDGRVDLAVAVRELELVLEEVLVLARSELELDDLTRHEPPSVRA